MQDDGLRAIPFIFYSATYTTSDDAKLAIALGATRYLVKPQEPVAFLSELTAVLRERVTRGIPDSAALLDENSFKTLHGDALLRKLEHKIAQLESANRALLKAEKQSRDYLARLERTLMNSVKVAMTLGEMRDPYTAGHERRVAEIAAAIGAELGLEASRQEGLRVAGYVHDIGKIALPAEILSKPGRLSAAEFQLIKEHPQASYDVLKSVEFQWPVAEIALQHHERLDGSGYPQGLKGEAILLEARIMSVADVVEAMASHRPYRAGLGIDKALGEVKRGKGTVYDPVVADACLRLFLEKGFRLPE
jgi:HD-GYP domain-containing protein (c-di-GMP phosphodiesterase class II)